VMPAMCEPGFQRMRCFIVGKEQEDTHVRFDKR
jgi:hypothetical protein